MNVANLVNEKNFIVKTNIFAELHYILLIFGMLLMNYYLFYYLENDRATAASQIVAKGRHETN